MICVGNNTTRIKNSNGRCSVSRKPRTSNALKTYMGLRILEYSPRVTSLRACGETEKDLPSWKRAVSNKTMAGTAMIIPAHRSLFHSPRQKITKKNTRRAAQVCAISKGTKLLLPDDIIYSINLWRTL